MWCFVVLQCCLLCWFHGTLRSSSLSTSQFQATWTPTGHHTHPTTTHTLSTLRRLVCFEAHPAQYLRTASSSWHSCMTTEPYSYDWLPLIYATHTTSACMAMSVHTGACLRVRTHTHTHTHTLYTYCHNLHTCTLRNAASCLF